MHRLAKVPDPSDQIGPNDRVFSGLHMGAGAHCLMRSTRTSRGTRCVAPTLKGDFGGALRRIHLAADREPVVATGAGPAVAITGRAGRRPNWAPRLAPRRIGAAAVATSASRACVAGVRRSRVGSPRGRAGGRDQLRSGSTPPARCGHARRTWRRRTWTSAAHANRIQTTYYDDIIAKNRVDRLANPADGLNLRTSTTARRVTRQADRRCLRRLGRARTCRRRSVRSARLGRRFDRSTSRRRCDGSARFGLRSGRRGGNRSTR